MRLPFLIFFIASAAIAQIEVTPSIGYQTGGEVQVNQLNTPLKDAATFGLTVSFERQPGRELDFFAFGSSTRAERNDPFKAPASVDVSVVYAQFGGRYVFHPETRTRPYIGISVGGTRIASGNGWIIEPSGGFGGGVDLQLSRTVALRIDGRYLTTLMSSSIEIGCQNSGTCAGTALGTQFAQFIASMGVVFRLK